jgi:SAM-dependent methyltransferase
MSPHRLRDAFDFRAAAYTPERIRLYNEVNARHPYAREAERCHVIDRLSLREGLTICDAAAGGGYVSDGIHHALGGRCRIVCVENSTHFADSLPDAYAKVLCSLSDLDLPSASVDRVACVAGIHHQEDKALFFREAHRILKPGGVIAVGDVLAGSPPALFLNEAVDRHSHFGHDGMFLAPGELSSLLAGAGFESVTERHETYTWDLPDRPSLVAYCKSLFRMERASLVEVEAELCRYLEIEEDDAGAHLEWGLSFARACKPGASGAACG